MKYIVRAFLAGTMLAAMLTVALARPVVPRGRGPVRLDEVDPLAARSLAVVDAGRIRATFSNWGEYGNPDGIPGYKGFEYPRDSGSDFLFSAGIWVGAIRDSIRLVSTSTDGDNGTNEFYPVHLGAVPAANGTLRADWHLSSLSLTSHDGDSYVRGRRGADDDGDWNALTDDLDGNLRPSRNYDGGGGILQFDDDDDGAVDEETTNSRDDDGDGLIDEDTQDGDSNGDHDAGYDPEPRIDEDPLGNMAADYLDNDYDGLVDAGDPDFDGDLDPATFDDDADGAADEDAAARADQELRCMFQDDIDMGHVGNPDNDGHTPLRVTVDQRALAWTYELSRDLVLLEFSVRNAGVDTLREMYLAFFADPDIGAAGEGGDAASLDDFNYFDSQRRMMVSYDNLTDGDGAGPGVFGVKVVKPPVPWAGARFSFRNFERISGGDPENNVAKYAMISSGAIAPPTNQQGDWRMLMGWGADDGSLSLAPGEAFDFTVAVIGAPDTATLNIIAGRLPVFDGGPAIGEITLYTSPSIPGPYVLSASFVDNDGVDYADGVAIHWLWQGHESAWQSAPSYAYVWSDPVTFSGEYYFMLPDTHASGFPLGLGDTLLFYLDGEDGFGNYSAHTLYQLVAGTGFLSAHVPVPAAAEFALAQNYPNPFNATTTISYSLPRAMSARLELYNLLGQKVATLAEGMQAAGSHRVSWNAQSAAAGVYVYCLKTEEWSVVAQVAAAEVTNARRWTRWRGPLIAALRWLDLTNARKCRAGCRCLARLFFR